MHQKGRTKGAAKRKDENVTHATTTTKKRSVPKGRVVVVVVVVGDGGVCLHMAIIVLLFIILSLGCFRSLFTNTYKIYKLECDPVYRCVCVCVLKVCGECWVVGNMLTTVLRTAVC